MDKLIEMLREEAKLFDNAEAAAILLVWDRDGVMPDRLVYAAGRIRLAREARTAQGRAKAKARREDKAARESEAVRDAAAETLIAKAQAARARIKARLQRPH